MHCCEPFQDDVLRHIRILILVHQYIVEHSGDFCTGGRAVPQEYVHIQQHIVEIHHPGLYALLCVKGIYLIDTRHFALAVLVYCSGTLTVFGRCNQVVLGIGDAGLHVFGLIDLVVQLEFLDAGLDEPLGVVCVVNGEVTLISDLGGIDPEKTYENGVEGAHIELSGGSCTHHQRDSLLHFLRRLIGEGQGENPLRGTAALEYIRNSAGQHARLPGACSRHNQHRSCGTFNCLFLDRIQPFENTCRSILHLLSPLLFLGCENSKFLCKFAALCGFWTKLHKKYSKLYL